VDRESEDLRPVHYMGNKSRFLDAIDAVVNEVARPGSTACDLFAGTAVVARRLAQRRPVICADIQAYSHVLARALTTPRKFSEREVEQLLRLAREWLGAHQPVVRDLVSLEYSALSNAGTHPDLLADVIEFGSLAVGGRSPFRMAAAKDRARSGIDPTVATLTWYYGGAYFSYQQALELDALRNALKESGGARRDSTAVAALLGTASDVVSTIGNHFAQPVQPRRGDGSIKRKLVTSVARSRRISVIDGFANWLNRYASLRPTAHPCTVVRADYRDTLSALPPDTGVIYADPPYTRDHYSRFYHVLETIALDDDPGITPGQGTSAPSRGLYRQHRHQSPFSIRTQVKPAFRELFAHAKRLDVPLVLSYSPMSEGTRARPETRLVSIQDLVRLAGEYFADVRLVDVASSVHSRFNRVELNAVIDGNAEVLVVATN
jgi:adenine-specific DNA-methyltransferase